MDLQAFHSALASKGMTKTELARNIGMDRATIYRKLATNGERFTVQEVNAIRRALRLDQQTANKIFFEE